MSTAELDAAAGMRGMNEEDSVEFRSASVPHAPVAGHRTVGGGHDPGVAFELEPRPCPLGPQVGFAEVGHAVFVDVAGDHQRGDRRDVVASRRADGVARRQQGGVGSQAGMLSRISVVSGKRPCCFLEKISLPSAMTSN